MQRGTSAYLKCRVIAVPEADFTWHMTSTLSQSTKEVHPTDPNRGESVLDLKRVHGQPNTYDSLLKLDNVRTEHYSTVFKCVANNSFGSDAHHIELVPPGIPDKPSRISIVQTTPSSVRLSWVPGFDAWAIADHASIAGQKRLVWDPSRLDQVEGWTTSPHMWTRRAALVMTLPWTKQNHPKPAELEARDRILGWAATYVTDPEWFIQKAIGWWLRELSKHDPDRVRLFIAQHGDQMKPFARKEALRKLPD